MLKIYFSWFRWASFPITTIFLCQQRQKSKKWALLEVSFDLRTQWQYKNPLITAEKEEHSVPEQLLLCWVCWINKILLDWDILGELDRFKYLAFSAVFVGVKGQHADPSSFSSLSYSFVHSQTVKRQFTRQMCDDFNKNIYTCGISSLSKRESIRLNVRLMRKNSCPVLWLGSSN